MKEQYVKRLGKVYFITYYNGDVRKQWQGMRDDLIELQGFIESALAAPGNNQNGKPIIYEKARRNA